MATQVTLNSGAVSSAGTLKLQTNGTTDAVHIDTSQNVGIGTSSPNGPLDVNASVPRVIMSISGTAKGQMNIAGSAMNITANDATYPITFNTGGAERARIDSSGNVGIGTNSPTAKLQVSNGTVNVDINPAGSNFYFGTSNNYPVIFNQNNTERMRLDTSGTLLVGATSNTISGATSKVYVECAASSLSNITLKDTGTTYGTNTQFITFGNSAGSVCGSIQHNAAGTVNYATSSDARLKENIVDAPNALNVVSQIPVRSYDWKEDSHHVDYGFIAQELHPYFPDAVCVGDDGDEITNSKMTWQVDYSKLTPLLLKAIQEQQAIIQQLQADVAQLKNK